LKSVILIAFWNQLSSLEPGKTLFFRNYRKITTLKKSNLCRCLVDSDLRPKDYFEWPTEKTDGSLETGRQGFIYKQPRDGPYSDLVSWAQENALP
jgi:hypothetical protein